jgi:hypothetical protein
MYVQYTSSVQCPVSILECMSVRENPRKIPTGEKNQTNSKAAFPVTDTFDRVTLMLLMIHILYEVSNKVENLGQVFFICLLLLFLL